MVVIIYNYFYVTLAFPIIIAAALLLFFAVYYRRAVSPKKGTVEWIDFEEKPRLCFAGKRYKMERRDIAPLLLITVIYAAIAFYGLGDNTAPQTFSHFEYNDKSVTIDLGSEVEVGKFMYYTGLYNGGYNLEFSEDGVTWDKQTSMAQEHSELFKWRYAELSETNQTVRYIRITALVAPLELGEIAVFDSQGNLVSSSAFTADKSDGNLLFDEQDIVPAEPSYLNSAYFDEIYHARTAYENIHNIYPYEISHPPLGKLIIAIGIKIFGMTPFGWRFMGTLFGILMLPVLYIFIKNIFGKTVVAVCGTLLFAFDFMHYTQTRIATIDTYGVFFLILMYYFMYRYLTEDYEAPFRKTAVPLFLCGLFCGIGAASKWTAIYGIAGIFVLYVIALVMRGRYYSSQRRRGEFARYTVKTLLFSVVAFIIIPAAIYCLSYIPYFTPSGSPFGFKLIWDNQVFMFHYHSTLVDTHPYSSTWWMWVFDVRPILYYLHDFGNGMKSAFGAFGNPIVYWGGLLAIISLFVSVWKRRSHTALFIIIGYFSQLFPWMLISRIAFAYHYFPSTIFLVLALAYVLDRIVERQPHGYKTAVYGLTGTAVVLFAMFYPVLSGLTVPTWYTTNILRWFPSWPF